PDAPPLPPRPSDVGAGIFGGGSGACVVSKQSDMSSAVSSRGLMDGTPNNSWQNFNRLMWERCVFETYPCREYGLMKRLGPGEPYRNCWPSNSGCASPGYWARRL